MLLYMHSGPQIYTIESRIEPVQATKKQIAELQRQMGADSGLTESDKSNAGGLMIGCML